MSFIIRGSGFLVKMLYFSPCRWLLALALSLSTITSFGASEVVADEGSASSLKTAVLLSPPFVLTPGSVANKYYYDIDFPRGHIAIKSFNADLVDEEGRLVPLHETYLHHWGAFRYYGLVESEEEVVDLHLPRIIHLRNSGTCRGALEHYFGLGAESRGSNIWFPDPYGVQVGNPKEIPNGYQERWMLNVHAIDTRGVEDRVGCIECKCSLYNVNEDEHGRPLRRDYVGGLHCCYDKAHCHLRDGFEEEEYINSRKLYLRYTVKWVDWDETSIVPVRIYILDVTDTANRLNGTSTYSDAAHDITCKIEYDVKQCDVERISDGGCIDNKKTTIVIPGGGDFILGYAHQHQGGTGSALYGQDGRLLCASSPTYGTGRDSGNEAGYILKMSACYPCPNSVKIVDGEVLTLESNYSSSQMHTGVMGLFHIMVADPQPMTISFINEGCWLSNYSQAVALIGLIAIVSALFCISIIFFRAEEEKKSYQSLAI